MKNRLNILKNNFEKEIKEIKSLIDLESLENKYLSRKSGELTLLVKEIKNLSQEAKKEIGQLFNDFKKEIEEKLISQKRSLSHEEENIIKNPSYFLASNKIKVGHLHPLTIFMRRINDIFLSMGFEILNGREVETEEYNFDLLNIAKDHPARDMWDTFYIKNQNKGGDRNLLLRTHTSPMQLRAMKDRKPPVRLIAPGRVFRHEATDPGHETTFYQCEGLVIDKGIKLTDLIGTLKMFLQTMYGEQVKIKLVPSFYPFVEPGLDIYMSCLICGGKGCGVCKQRGWLEMLGSGMVHPKVLKNMNIDPEIYSGFAFGLGVDRLMMLNYGINDVRLSYSGDLRFIKQF